MWWILSVACLRSPEPTLDVVDDDILPVASIGEARDEIWSAFLASAPPAEDKAIHSVSWQEHTLRYTLQQRGARPEQGWPVYIALHGGGGAPTAVNDAQWASMQGYYLDSVEVGLYVAPRGISDTWNLHFNEASYALYDTLIEHLVRSEGADPDRIYLMGFSAGGDGVYQITPRMADRFAGAVMSAGHPNGVSAENLYNLPFLIQMGEQDDAYDRARVAAQQDAALDALQAAHPGGYVHDLFLHIGGLHNLHWSDRDPSDARYPVIADTAAWLEGEAGGERSVDANAVRWLGAHVRDPRPERIRWQPGLVAGTRGEDARWWYWVGVEDDPETWGERVVVSLDRSRNTVVIEESGPRLRLRLDESMVDLSVPLRVEVGGASWSVSLEPRRSVLERSLRVWGDPRRLFVVELIVDRATGVVPATSG